MVKNAMVEDQVENGRRLIDALAETGFEVRAAFWIKPTDEDSWFLYLASPFWDDRGPKEAYRHVFRVMRNIPDLWIEPMEVRLVGMNDSRTIAATAATKASVSNSPLPVQQPRGMTAFGGSTMGGASIDGAYIYPPMEPTAP